MYAISAAVVREGAVPLPKRPTMCVSVPRAAPWLPDMCKFLAPRPAPPGVAEVQQLLGEVVTATMRELEELREQGETELASVIGDDHARTARLRQDYD